MGTWTMQQIKDSLQPQVLDEFFKREEQDREKEQVRRINEIQEQRRAQREFEQHQRVKQRVR